MSCYAFIFARSGSSRLKNKNLKKINGKPLVTHSILAAKKVKEIKKIFVSTDSNQISKLAYKLGAIVIKRPKYLCTATSNEWLSWQHAVIWVVKNISNFKKFVSLPTTSPLRITIDISNSIKKFNKKCDAVITYTDAKNSPWFNMVKKNGKFMNLALQGKPIFRFQDAKKLYNICTVAYVTSPKYILNSKSLFDGKVVGSYVPIERSIDIDTKFDLKIAKLLKRNNEN